MQGYFAASLFLYTAESAGMVERVETNPQGCVISSVLLEEFLKHPEELLQDFEHVVVAASLAELKKVMLPAMELGFSLGILPADNQNNLHNNFGLPRQFDRALDVALQRDPLLIDAIFCNEELMLFKASMGRMPLLDNQDRLTLRSMLPAMRSSNELRLLPFTFRTKGGSEVKTAASGCMILQHHERTLASRLIAHDSCLADGMISLVITAPLSLLDYVIFLAQARFRPGQGSVLPQTIGYIKSAQIDVESPQPLTVTIDDHTRTTTPLCCRVKKQALHINVGEGLRQSKVRHDGAKEKVATRHLPQGKELAKAIGRRIPLFSYASEERFRELFVSLREDAQIDATYLVLMLLSSMLATVGLYMNSSSVIIGAMLLAPLMAPIVSLAMGLLRQDTKMTRASVGKVILGICIALSSGAFISLLFPFQPETSEMQARLNPSLLDLAVAIISGAAGAYTKANRKILASLAGVSIAVALVPPLATAGIGLGIRDFDFFIHAFLLFSTNLIGISLAATFTFRLLGYSPVVRDKKGLGIVLIFLMLITGPLYLSYQTLVHDSIMEENWRHERFLIHDKYLIVRDARVMQQRGQDLLYAQVLAREPLDRRDLTLLRKKIQAHFNTPLKIRVRLIYIP